MKRKEACRQSLAEARRRREQMLGTV